MTDTFRAMCAELVDALAQWRLGGGPPEDTADASLIARARALLAQPVAEGPTVMEIIELHSWLEDEWRANNDGEDLPTLDFARAVLAKWGRPTPQPVAEGPTVPNSKLHRQELTPLEITLLIEALDFAIGDIKARPNSSKHVAVRAKLKRSISRPKATND